MSNPEAIDSRTTWSRYRIGARPLDQVLGQVASLAVRALGADVVGLTVDRGDGPVTVTTTDPASRDMDDVQYTGAGGPCMEALLTSSVVTIPSLALDERWPDFNEAARSHGIRSTLSVPLPTERDVLGVLNAYARQESAFSENSRQVGEALAEQVASLLARAAEGGHSEPSVGDDLGSQAVVDYAIGILVANGAGTTADARQSLVDQARRAGQDVAELAVKIVERAEGRSRMSPEELARSYAELGTAIDGGRHGRVLDRVVEVAVHRVPRADSASVTLLQRGRFTTVAASDERARRADQLQYELGSGPCISAAREELAFAPADLEADGRWPTFARQVGEREGIRSMLCYQLSPDLDEVVACLNLYGTVDRAFDDESVVVGTLVAAHASSVLVTELERHRADHLQQALQSNREIGVAIGVLMQQRKITREAAFDLLRIASQHSNRKLRDVATDVADTGQLPLPGDQRPRR